MLIKKSSQRRKNREQNRTEQQQKKEQKKERGKKLEWEYTTTTKNNICKTDTRVVRKIQA